MNGAEKLVETLIDGGVDTCFANPGTSEMHFVAALDRNPGMRCVLGLFEGVVTGAADGYYRMADRPAATLLHLGPGLANGLANLHNAKKAHSGVVNVVGEHASTHLELDAPLTSDIAALAKPMSHWVRTIASANDVEADAVEAIREANAQPGRIATLIMPADSAWNVVECASRQVAKETVAMRLPEEAQLVRAAAALKRGSTTLLLLGDRAVRAAASGWAGRISAATGCSLMAEFYDARLERGAGRVKLPRLPYAVEPSLKVLAQFDRIVLVGARAPVAFFAYPGKPGCLYRPDCEVIEAASLENDAEAVLRELCERVGGYQLRPSSIATLAPEADLRGPLNADSLGRAIAAAIPEHAIVVDESLTTGRKFDQATLDSAPHDWLTGSGGSIGFALPVAVGAAIAAPGRKVIALEGDGSGMYTLQSLWTMVREQLDITVVIFANRAYQILRGEFANVGAGEPGPSATSMLSLDRPNLDWVALAQGMGMNATRVSELETFQRQFKRALASQGPSLIEVML
ncbi:acetolactate synthase large subunit [Paraburkholderia bannensis]|uniref:acetolactate synthase large subunit n=1 Tax=Paraburkholderia bannensis TaxID=765414 RepID=UPI002AAFF3BB|nr:acetolactate synthase large subunit [Paraburkholderia bannensis]